MPPATDTTGKPAAELIDTVASTLSLLQNFTKNLESHESSPQSIPKDSPEPLDVLHTVATLLKAHTTKLSLLIINEPFTPSAIRKAINDIANTCVPAMMSAVGICQPLRYGKVLHDEVKAYVGKAFKELEHMMQELLTKLNSLSDKAKSQASKNRNSLASTGVLWNTCDRLIELKSLGLAGLVVRKAQLYKSMLEDAMSELREWAEGEDDEETGVDSDSADSLEEMFSPETRIPKDRTDVREALELSLRKLKQIRSLYNSLVKQRFKVINIETDRGGSHPGSLLPVAARVNQAMDHLRRIPEQVDELAGSFYELDCDKAEKLTAAICQRGKDVTEVMRIGWTGEEDSFTSWAGVWMRLIDQT